MEGPTSATAVLQCTVFTAFITIPTHLPDHFDQVNKSPKISRRLPS